MAARLAPSGRPYGVVRYADGVAEVHSAAYGLVPLRTDLTPQQATECARHLNGGAEPSCIDWPYARRVAE